jgi:hypothetical protein
VEQAVQRAAFQGGVPMAIWQAMDCSARWAAAGWSRKTLLENCRRLKVFSLVRCIFKLNHSKE